MPELKEKIKDPRVEFNESIDDLGWGEMWINLGPSHPATHGIIRFLVKTSGERILECDTQVGYLHRGFEKMCETHTWNQAIIYTDRLNYVSPIINNVGFALAVEKLLGVEVPPRGQYIRTIACEISRVSDHLTYLAAVGLELGAMTVMLYCMKAREWMYELIEELCGARVTTNATRVGGQPRDLPHKFAEMCFPRFKQVRGVIKEIDKLLTRNRIFYDRMRNVGVMPAEEAVNRSWTGPCLRASGVPYDVRRDSPYLVYEELDFEIPVGTIGDCMDRYLVRMEEMEQSLRICEQGLNRIPEGAYKVDDPRVALPDKYKVYNTIEGLINHFKLIMDGHGIRPPTGEVYQAVEGGNGEVGFYIVSDGEDRPYRVRCRPPCLPLTASMAYMMKDSFIADIVPIFDSINMIGGELDR